MKIEEVRKFHLAKPLRIPDQVWCVVKTPESRIEDATPEERSYLAGLIDGEGNLDIKKDTQPRIIVKMKNLAPLRLAERYGRYWYVEFIKKHGSVNYVWYIQGYDLVSSFVEALMLYSRVKREEFQLLRKDIVVIGTKRAGWKKEVQEIAKKLKARHKQNPVVTAEAAAKLDEKNPGWRNYVKKGTTIESKKKTNES